MATQYLTTSPEVLKGVDERHKVFAAGIATVETGIASKFWLELLAYPPGSARSLWLFVKNAWRHMDNPSEGTQISVQDAFTNLANFEVAVWFSGDVIVGLVVRTK